ncbi:uncharacterized protein LOC129224082 isoform X3 [Uloborus diversus]|uniref:uncharacterized protein LOC129224082 isoform X3 n=1 Tax=Uloborus diversus TaxID=327109 RepID=UPI0024097737|nr:uncharacterized protein LOC129224082 isoform X3 [Uloborus diversus]
MCASHDFFLLQFDVILPLLGLIKISFSTHENLHTIALADIFSHLKNITVLNMEDTCNDDALKNIAKYCPHLVELNIADSPITKEGFSKYLCQKNERNEVPNLNLRRLNLDGTEVDDDVTKLILTSFPHLELLEAPCMPCVLHEMHDKDVDQNNIANLKKYKLIHLDAIMCTHLASSPQLLKVYASVCPDVRILTLIVVNPEQLNTLTTFTKLENVNLESDESFPLPVANSFLSSRGAGLTVLKLNGFSISVEVLINSCPRLEELCLKDTFFQPVAETSKKELKFLKKIYLEGAVFIDVATSTSLSTLISSTRKLEKICISCCGHFTDEFKEAIKYCCINCPLRKVYFYHSESDLPMLQSILLSSRSLKVLRVVNSSLGFQNLKPEDVELLTAIASSLKNKPEFDFENTESDFNSDDDFHDILDLYDVFDDYDAYGDDSGDYDDYDDDDDFDDDDF